MLLDYLVFFLGVALIVWITRSRRKTLLNREIEFELYELRDKLRVYEFTSYIKSDSWTYDYLDQSICKTIDSLRDINIYTAYGLNKIHYKDESINEFKAKLTSALAKNKKESEIYEEYKDIVTKYVMEKHKAFALFFKAFILIKVFKALRKRQKNDIENFTVLPETSASLQFIKSGMRFS